MIFNFENLEYFKYCFLCNSKNFYRRKNEYNDIFISEELILTSLSLSEKFHFLCIFCPKCTNQQMIFNTEKSLFESNKLDLNYQCLYFEQNDYVIDYLTNKLRIFNMKNNTIQNHDIKFHTIPTFEKLQTIYNLNIFL